VRISSIKSHVSAAMELCCQRVAESIVRTKSSLNIKVPVRNGGRTGAPGSSMVDCQGGEDNQYDHDA